MLNAVLLSCAIFIYWLAIYFPATFDFLRDA